MKGGEEEGRIYTQKWGYSNCEKYLHAVYSGHNEILNSDGINICILGQFSVQCPDLRNHKAW